MGNFSKSKDGLTMVRHQEIGKRLKQIQHEITALHVELTAAYPISNPNAKKAINASGNIAGLGGNLDKLRCSLENLMAKQHPTKWDVDVYYGPDAP